MDKLQLVLLVLQIIVAVLMVIAVLLQKSDGDSLSGIGGGSGGLNSVISAKASGSALAKFTMILASVFMLNCLVLALISSKKQKSGSLQIDKVLQKEESSKSAPASAPAVPPVE
jgi:preprotein translocase subunit SecG